MGKHLIHRDMWAFDPTGLLTRARTVGCIADYLADSALEKLLGLLAKVSTHGILKVTLDTWQEMPNWAYPTLKLDLS